MQRGEAAVALCRAVSHPAVLSRAENKHLWSGCVSSILGRGIRRRAIAESPVTAGEENLLRPVCEERRAGPVTPSPCSGTFRAQASRAGCPRLGCRPDCRSWGHRTTKMAYCTSRQHSSASVRGSTFPSDGPTLPETVEPGLCCSVVPRPPSGSVGTLRRGRWRRFPKTARGPHARSYTSP